MSQFNKGGRGAPFCILSTDSMVSRKIKLNQSHFFRGTTKQTKQSGEKDRKDLNGLLLKH